MLDRVMDRALLTRALDAADSVLFRVFPPLSRWSRLIVVEMRRSRES